MDNYAIIFNDVVISVALWDGVNEWVPPDGCTIVKSNEAVVGSSYVNGKFIAPEPPPAPPMTAEEVIAASQSTRDYLLSTAALAIAPLQDAVDLDEATTEEATLLKAWKQYRVAVNRVDLSAPSWPVAPSA